MNCLRHIAFFLLVVLSFFTCKVKDNPIPNYDLIPLPRFIDKSDQMSSVADIDNALQLSVDTTISGFIVEISDKAVIIAATNEALISSALNRLRQLQKLNHGFLPICNFKHDPAFSYRGMHLDVVRHFFSVEEVKKYLDFLAFYGYNTFHWHLTDDQGWRIEIKKYPKLQSIAGYRDSTLVGHYNDTPHQFDQERYGGYYTQEQVKEIVNYAEQLGITIIPEIEMPGHSSAALAAYPELGCFDKKYAVAAKWGVFEDVFCPKERTFTFLQDVLDEVMTLFPSDYIHIGGDECPKVAWKSCPHCQSLIKKKGLKDEHELQSYFINRIEKYLNAKGKRIIGWDEILEGGLAPNATVMSWRGEKGGIEAARNGHQVIMTPGSHCYFDHYQSDHPKEPVAIGGYTSVKKVFDYQPIPDALENEFHQFVLGAQGNVWTEYIPNANKLQYMALARMATLSEVLWNDKEKGEYNDFSNRLLNHIDYWQENNVNMANHLLDPVIEMGAENGQMCVKNNDKNLPGILYLKSPTSDWDELEGDQHCLKDPGTYSFKIMKDGISGRTQSIEFKPHVGVSASIDLETAPSGSYTGYGTTSLQNGIQGRTDKYSGNEWLGFFGDDFEAKYSWLEPKDINQIEMRFFDAEGQWIHLPSELKLNIDGKPQEILFNTSRDKKTVKYTAEIDCNPCHSLTIHAENYTKSPTHLEKVGHKSWLFVDEIILK